MQTICGGNMAQDSRIEWTHHTFNPWWGCTRISPACTNCYADSWAQRLALDLWGPKAPRRFFSDAHWKEPYKWNRDAIKQNQRRRVFCASMADVFEDRRDLDPWRERLWPMIEETPALDWLLLTKRPELIKDMVPWKRKWPANVWLGTTAEDQKWANERIPALLRLPAQVRFVSCEPLLGPLDLRKWLAAPGEKKGLHWVIAGGESGPKARPMGPSWAESLRDQCLEAGTAFHFKQWGHWGPESAADRRAVATVEMVGTDEKPVRLYKLGKHATGRLLDGRTWDQFPQN
ncbi:Gp37Gp68 family protein [Burkholderia pseudomallei]|nr:phage Gp37/Gp68 family protein [Burkholderia pseudomallei MSHR305]AHK64747.1 phage Gp37/Gp68 family protein [Burkholderia pseudomallei MSHR520]AIO95269.1 phage Gp37/Gp68 family protein [Burkholderia pseudomallei 576]AIP79931.1 phage Gp37/Gp68 family protein [Burkholderia pseudomallei]KGW53803.1 phage Gp37/Gp68 family protein [Burkholderia pseudomallei MSHR303]KKB69294.1 phage Gp37/Gp68 family protein [Burkholderia pseudomallei MSHR1079]